MALSLSYYSTLLRSSKKKNKNNQSTAPTADDETGNESVWNTHSDVSVRTLSSVDTSSSPQHCRKGTLVSSATVDSTDLRMPR